METLLIQPKTKEQFKAIETLAKAFDIPFKKTESKSPYNPVFVEKIKKSAAEARKGQTVKIKLDDIWK